MWFPRTSLVLSLIACLAVGRAAAPAAPAVRPNVVLIMPDDVSWDDFSFFNPKGPRTPHIDGLARTSVRLTDFHVSPTCSPTRAALMTGRYNDATGVWHTIVGRYFLRVDEVTMADIFKANGYRTALFGKWHLGDDLPFGPRHRGFEHTAMIRGGGIDQQHNPWGNRDIGPATLFVDNRPVPLTVGDDGMDGAYSTNFFTTRALAYMRKCTSASEPFFAYVAYNVAHGPNDTPPGARAGTDARTATIENLDQNIGRLLRHLAETGLAANTLVVFLTDNGMSNALLRGGKASHYEGGHRVPCLLRWPNGGLGGTEETSREVANLSSHIDLLPTLMDLFGLKDVSARGARVPLHGVSLRPVLAATAGAKAAAWRERVVVVDNQRMDELVRFRQASVMRDAFDPSGKLMHKWRLNSAAAPGQWELYDLLADPKQRDDLAAKAGHAAVAAELSAAYDPWWREIAARASEYNRPIIGAAAAPAACLYSHDWHTEEMVPWNHTMVAEGLRANGVHTVEFARAGTYTFDLRRWPREIADETTATSALARPISHTTGNKPYLGKALPIHSARLRIWQGDRVVADERQAVGREADGAMFSVPGIPVGPASIQTWFYDAAGQEICGAYYNYVSPR